MKNKENEKFINMDVENLNIVDKNGTVRLSLFNSDNMPPLIFEGEDILPGHRQGSNKAGLMFFNAQGTECGGLIFGSEKNEETGEYSSGLSLTFDQYNHDQLIQMSVIDDNGTQNYGISIFDRPNETIKDTFTKINKMSTMEDECEKSKLLRELKESNARRMFMGKSSDGEVSVKLSDSKGNERIRMVIDKNDVPKLEFLNEKGEVIYSLPPEI